MASFVVQLAEFARKAGANADLVVRKTVLDIGTRIVERSPVGDPTLWKHPAPKGYVGGRFRANWQYGSYNYSAQGSIPSGDLPDIDPTGGVSLARIEAGLQLEGAAGMIHVILNNLPYAQALEDGWSSQAPQGMVGLTAIEFQSIVRAAAQGVS